jgi:predicted ATPase
MPLTQPQRIVIAGGPGSGKSTLLQALADSGEVCYEESSRILIREQVLDRLDRYGNAVKHG